MSEVQQYYSSIIKPDFAPTPETISMIWMVLYVIIAISFAYMIYRVYKGKMDKFILIPMGINLVSNAIFIFLFTRSELLSVIDILIVWGTILWLIILTFKKEKFFAVAMLPYILWVTIASYFQIYIFLFN